jgi:hypothetical protein
MGNIQPVGGPVRQPYAAVIFMPPVRDYEFGNRPRNVWAILSVMKKKKCAKETKNEDKEIRYRLIKHFNTLKNGYFEISFKPRCAYTHNKKFANALFFSSMR